MQTIPSDIAFTPAVKSIQKQNGSRESYARMEQSRGWQTTVTPELAEFNCPQHIHKRFSQRQVAPVIEKLQDRVRELEAELVKVCKGNEKVATN